MNKKVFRLRQYKRNYDNFATALDSVLAWHSKAVELAHATYDVPRKSVKEVEVKKITEVTKTGAVDFVIETIKGENRTGDLIELRMKNYKKTDKIEASFLYKGKKQAYVEEAYIGDIFRIEFENYANPNLSTTFEVTPSGTAVSSGLGVYDVKVIQGVIVITDTVTLEDEDPVFIHQIIEAMQPLEWIPIAALDPGIVGASLPPNADDELLSWKNKLKRGLCAVGVGAGSAASGPNAGLMDIGLLALNLKKFLN